MRVRTLFVIGSALWFASVVPARAQSCCVLPDNGTGTVDLPPDCPPDGYVGSLELIEGLPPGSAVEMAARLTNIVATQSAGGTLGGAIEMFTATMHLEVTGTGTLAGFNRTLAVPVTGETHSAPRTPGAAVQDFNITMYRLQGILTGDYDFALLWFEGGGI